MDTLDLIILSLLEFGWKEFSISFQPDGILFVARGKGGRSFEARGESLPALIREILRR